MNIDEKYSRVCALINLDNAKANILEICNKINNNTKIYAIIKADGYGHGAVELAHIYEEIEQIQGYGVATAEEALTLVNAGIKKDIVIIGYTFPYAYESLIRENIRITVFREDTIDELSQIANRLGKNAKVHIKVDTGMSRIGVNPLTDGSRLAKKLIDDPNIDVEGIFTHFSRADEADKKHANGQFGLFCDFVNKIEKENNFKFLIKHCSNSAAIIDLPDANMDVVRAGIILYGLWPSDEVNKNNITLKPVMSLISHIIYIKTVPKDTMISYGGTYITDKDTRIATIPVGYADGYQRRLSGKAYVLIRGKKAPIVGRICMDQFMVDVTDIEGCQLGDMATLIGHDGDENITIEQLSNLSEQLNYEFACDIGKRVPRLYVKNDEIIV